MPYLYKGQSVYNLKMTFVMLTLLCVFCDFSKIAQSVGDISGVPYTVYYKEEGKPLQVENVIDVGTTTAQLPVVVGRTYVVWVTSVVQGVESAPSNSLTLGEFREHG